MRIHSFFLSLRVPHTTFITSWGRRPTIYLPTLFALCACVGTSLVTQAVEDCTALDGVELPSGSPLVYGRLYCYTVVVSNTGPKNVRMDVTIQAPQVGGLRCLTSSLCSSLRTSRQQSIIDFHPLFA